MQVELWTVQELGGTRITWKILRRPIRRKKFSARAQNFDLHLRSGADNFHSTTVEIIGTGADLFCSFSKLASS